MVKKKKKKAVSAVCQMKLITSHQIAFLQLPLVTCQTKPTIFNTEMKNSGSALRAS